MTKGKKVNGDSAQGHCECAIGDIKTFITESLIVFYKHINTEIREIKYQTKLIQTNIEDLYAFTKQLNKENINKIEAVESQVEDNLKKLKELTLKNFDLEQNVDIVNLKQKATECVNISEVVNRNFNLNDIQVSKFTGTYFLDGRGSHPRLFIQELDSAIQINNIPDRFQLELAKRSLQDVAAHWFITHSEDIREYDDFKNKFMGQYWNLKIQVDYVHSLYLEKHNKKVPLAQHFLKHVSIAKLVDKNVLNEETMIKAITCHFNDEVKSNLIFSGAKTVDGILEMLIEYDKILKHKNNNASNANYRYIPQNDHRQRNFDNDNNRQTSRQHVSENFN